MNGAAANSLTRQEGHTMERTFCYSKRIATEIFIINALVKSAKDLADRYDRINILLKSLLDSDCIEDIH